MHVEQWDRQAKQGNQQAEDMIDVIETFYNLCKVIKDPSP
jgi:hypothetical protein